VRRRGGGRGRRGGKGGATGNEKWRIFRKGGGERKGRTLETGVGLICMSRQGMEKSSSQGERRHITPGTFKPYLVRTLAFAHDPGVLASYGVPSSLYHFDKASGGFEKSSEEL